jgi:hypothetical protein
MPLLHVEIFVFKNTKISIFGGISKFRFWANFGKFWRFWVVLGSFGQIWADFAALTVAESMPKLWLKS